MVQMLEASSGNIQETDGWIKFTKTLFVFCQVMEARVSLWS